MCRRAIVVVALACQACIVVPKLVRGEPVVLGTQRAAPVVVSAGKLAVAASFADDRLTVVATQERTCRREVTMVVDSGESMDADVVAPPICDHPDGARGCLAGAMLVLVASPFTMLVSGIVTGIVIAAHDKHRVHTVTKIETTACPVPAARAAVELVLASQRALTVITDDAGRAVVAIPDDEPGSGNVVARLADARAVTSYVMAAACATERELAYARASAVSPPLRAKALAHVPVCRDADAAVWKVITSATDAAMRGTCARIGSDLQFVVARAPELAPAFSDEPDVAFCLAEFARAEAIARATVAGRSRR